MQFKRQEQGPVCSLLFSMLSFTAPGLEECEHFATLNGFCTIGRGCLIRGAFEAAWDLDKGASGH